MIRLLRLLFWILIARPLVLVVLGLNVRDRQRLPKAGPAIVVANHNSHLDTFVLMSLFPLRMLNQLRPVAAADYFLRTRPLAWFTLNIVNMIPLDRKMMKAAREADPLKTCSDALAAGQVLLIYPEGTRGESESLAKFKGGVARLKEQHPDVPVIIISGSGGGARMHEGILSLMQMAKVSAALARYDQAGGLFISVLTNPTMGGVAASFASLGDLVFAEPKALIGFAGPRVIESTIRIELPKGFQTSKFLLEHGFVDRIVHRADLKTEIARAIDYCGL